MDQYNDPHQLGFAELAMQIIQIHPWHCLVDVSWWTKSCTSWDSSITVSSVGSSSTSIFVVFYDTCDEASRFKRIYCFYYTCWIWNRCDCSYFGPLKRSPGRPFVAMRYIELINRILHQLILGVSMICFICIPGVAGFHLSTVIAAFGLQVQSVLEGTSSRVRCVGTLRNWRRLVTFCSLHLSFKDDVSICLVNFLCDQTAAI